MKIVIVGANGLVGVNFTRAALESDDVAKVYAFARRDNNLGAIDDHPKLERMIEDDSYTWEKSFPTDADVLISTIGTARIDAMGKEHDRIVSHNLQTRLAARASEHGYKCMLLLSAMGANPSSRVSYFKLKGETEMTVKEMRFPKTIIMRPGPIVEENVAAEEESSKIQFSLGKLASLTQTVKVPFFHRKSMHSFQENPVEATVVARFGLELIKTLHDGFYVVQSEEIIHQRLRGA